MTRRISDSVSVGPCLLGAVIAAGWVMVLSDSAAVFALRLSRAVDGQRSPTHTTMTRMSAHDKTG